MCSRILYYFEIVPQASIIACKNPQHTEKYTFIGKWQILRKPKKKTNLIFQGKVPLNGLAMLGYAWLRLSACHYSFRRASWFILMRKSIRCVRCLLDLWCKLEIKCFDNGQMSKKEIVWCFISFILHHFFFATLQSNIKQQINSILRFLSWYFKWCRLSIWNPRNGRICLILDSFN